MLILKASLWEMIWDLVCRFPGITCCFIFFGLIACLGACALCNEFSRFSKGKGNHDSVALKIRIFKNK